MSVSRLSITLGEIANYSITPFFPMVKLFQKRWKFSSNKQNSEIPRLTSSAKNKKKKKNEHFMEWSNFIKKKWTPLAYIINARNFWRSKFWMVSPTTRRVNPTTSYSLLQDGIINRKVEHLINFSALPCKHLIKLHQRKDMRVKTSPCMKFTDTIKRTSVL